MRGEMKMRKKLLSIVLSVFMLCSSTIGVYATEDTQAADASQQETQVVEETETVSSEAPVDKTGYEGMETEVLNVTDKEYNELQQKNSTLESEKYSAAKASYWGSFTSDYYYKKLSKEEKKAWDELNRLCISVAESSSNISGYGVETKNYYFKGWSTTKAFDFVNTFKISHPQYFFLSNRSFLRRNWTKGYILGIRVYDSFKNGSYRKNQVNAFCKKVNGWVAQIKKQPSKLPEARHKAAFDIVCKNTVYKYGTYDQSAYSLVCQGKTVCAGYAATLQMLLNACGVKTVEVTSIDHAWNIVYIHGNWYQSDTTWADKDSDGIDYTYYGKSEKTLTQGGKDWHHAIESFWKKPVAKYDELTTKNYVSPYFNSGNYKWFIVNKRGSLSGGYLAAPILTYNNASVAKAPAYITYNKIKYKNTRPASAPKSAETSNAVKGLRIAGRASNALRLSWNSDSKVNGYIIEQYKGNKWVRLVKLTSNKTNTYRISKLTASYTYKYRVKTYRFTGKTPIYSSYVYINGRTCPKTMSVLKIGGRAKDALRLNWSRNYSAKGYIVERYNGSKWVRVKKITSNATTTCRIAGLSRGKTYKFRVKTYDFDGKTPIYSGYKYISGKTL